MIPQSDSKFLIPFSDPVPFRISSTATLPPKYLQYPESKWKACSRIQSEGTWDSLCFPGIKPDGCDQKIWEEMLGELKQCRPQATSDLEGHCKR